MTRDLGTYFLKVELVDGRGWIQEWNTGGRYTRGSGGESPLDADYILPTYDTEEDVFRNMRYMYLEGNYSCDDNKTLFWCRSQQIEEPESTPCGNKMVLKSLTAIRPDRSEVVLYPPRNSHIQE